MSMEVWLTPVCVLVLITLLQQSAANVITVPGTNRPTGGSTVAYGNPLINGTTTVQLTGFTRSWVDLELILIPGRVVSFYAAICPTTDITPQQSVTMWFQIWQATSNTTEYKLIYGQRHVMPNRFMIAEVPVPTDTRLMVSTNVRLGWTTEGSNNILCYNFEANYRTQHRGLDDGIIPAVNSTLNFHSLVYPAIFSIAMEIDTRFVGDTGPMGATGPVGQTGSSGERGLQGPVGHTGFTGSTGLPGATGTPGAQGELGPRGPTGETGHTGPKGDQGPAGNDGRPGDTGFPGSTGQPGATGSSGRSGPTGPRGDTGFPGPQGPVGSTGSLGATGDTGPSGRPGSDGPKGNTGDTGNSGSTGATGSVGATGLEGRVGATGPKGDRGDVGPMGPQGPPGTGGAATDYCRTARCSYGCTNSVLSFTCYCAPGYQLNSDRLTCSDMNECASSNGGCAQICQNNIGSFSCSCRTGYELGADDRMCTDIDECQSSPCPQICVNTNGGYRCIELSFAQQGKPSSDPASNSVNVSFTSTGIVVWLIVLTVFVAFLAICFIGFIVHRLRNKSRQIIDDTTSQHSGVNNWSSVEVKTDRL